jgi:DNA-binding NtrC family response regulator
MSKPLVVFLGDFKDEHVPWDELSGHLGWRFLRSATLDTISEVREHGEVPAVYLDYREGSCVARSLAAIKSRVPNARVVVCYPMSAPVMADELVAAGAFHSVPRPLHLGELKQSLGFVWEAWSRRARRLDSMIEIPRQLPNTEWGRENGRALSSAASS